MTRRFSLLDDCLLAIFALAAASFVILLFATSFSWPAVLALLIVPTILLSTYRRYRAAGICAAVALLAGAWEIVPPAGSFAMDGYGIAAIVAFASGAVITIAMAAWIADRRIAAQTSH
jgi:K+-sensing histidine kinase KdpD